MIDRQRGKRRERIKKRKRANELSVCFLARIAESSADLSKTTRICVCLYMIPTFIAFQIVLIPLDVSYLSLSRRNSTLVRGPGCACVCECACGDDDAMTRSGSLPRLLFTIVIEKKRACKIGRPFLGASPFPRPLLKETSPQLID